MVSTDHTSRTESHLLRQPRVRTSAWSVYFHRKSTLCRFHRAGGSIHGEAQLCCLQGPVDAILNPCQAHRPQLLALLAAHPSQSLCHSHGAPTPPTGTRPKGDTPTLCHCTHTAALLSLTVNCCTHTAAAGSAPLEAGNVQLVS